MTRLLACVLGAMVVLGCSRADAPGMDDKKQDAEQNAKVPPALKVNLPKRGIKVGQPFTITVLVPDMPGDASEHQIHMDASDPFDYKPLDFTLKAGGQQRVEATLKDKLDSGLAEINIRADGFRPFLYVVDAGFSGRLKALVPASIQSRHAYPLTMQIVDEKDTPIRLDTDAHLTITALNGTLAPQGLAGEGGTSTGFEMDLRAGSSSSPTFMLRPTSIAGDPVVLVAQMTPAKSTVSVAEQRVEIPVVPAWW